MGSYAATVLGLAPPSAFEAALREAFAAADGAVKRAFGEEAWALPFGSIVQGAHLDGSDLDLCFDVPDEENSAVQVNGKWDNSKQVAALKKLLSALKGQFRVVETRFWKHMRVPIVILGFRDRASGLEVETDFSVGTVYEDVQKGLTDRVIRRLLAQCPKALHMARLVKLWSKVEKLHKAYDGYLNSLGWTLLVLYHCMEKLLICNSLIYEEEPNELGEDGSGKVLPPPLHADEGAGDPPEEDLPTCDELADFFEWVAAWEEWWPSEPPPSDGAGSQVWAISLVDRALIAAPPPAKVFPDSSPFFIEDPGVRMSKDSTENVARSLKKATWRTTGERCAAAASTLRRAAQSDRGAQAWVAGLVRRCAAAQAAPAAGVKRPLPPVTPPWAAAGKGFAGAAFAGKGFAGNGFAGKGFAGKGAFGKGGGGAFAPFGGEPPAKRARGGEGVCKWFLRNECWSGDNCKQSHVVG